MLALITLTSVLTSAKHNRGLPAEPEYFIIAGWNNGGDKIDDYDDDEGNDGNNGYDDDDHA